MKTPRTTLIIAGQTIWPIRWRFVLGGVVRALYRLMWIVLGYTALMALAIRSPYLDNLTRWRLLDILAQLGMTQGARDVLPLVVVAIFCGNQVWGLIDVFWPGREA